MKNRRSLTPSDAPDEPGDVHATRRGGARHEISARVTMRRFRAPPVVPGVATDSANGTDGANGADGANGTNGVGDADGADGSAELEGWALNVSRGGLRVILEGTVELGAEFEVTMTGSALGEDNGVPRIGRIVWLQEEPDGVVAGIEFRQTA